jgi:hypothetical protein
LGLKGGEGPGVWAKDWAIKLALCVVRKLFSEQGQKVQCDQS